MANSMTNVRSSHKKLVHSRQQWVLLVLLWLAVIISSLSVVYSAYDTRNKFDVLQKLFVERNHYQIEWSQYLLEESAWASYGRIESVAKKDLSMRVPTFEHIVMVNAYE